MEDLTIVYLYNLEEDTYCNMSNTNSSEDNVESRSVYGNNTYKEYRKKEKSKDPADTSTQDQINTVNGRELEEGQTFQY